MSQNNLQPESMVKKKKRALLIAAVAFILMVVMFIVSLNTGFIKISPVEVVQTIFGQGTDQQALVLFQFRLPRMIIAVLVGMGLAVSGTVLQGIVRNPLADPGIIGINAGAGMAVMVFISFLSTDMGGSVYILPLAAFLGAALTAVVIYSLSYKRGEGVSPIRLILVGVAVAAGISALMIVLTLKLDPRTYQFLATWLAGSIWGSSWSHVYALVPWLLVLFPFVYMKSSVLNVLNLGDSTSISLGLNLERERRILLAAAVALAASSVSVSGGIGFVGLIAPHITRQLVGSNHRYVIPISALIGGLLVLLADTIGRVVLQPSEIPAGIIVAIIGAPYFLYLLAKLKD